MQNINDQKAGIKPVRMVCLHCRQLPKNHREVMEINYFGYHMTCDHVMSDVNDQKKSEYQDRVEASNACVDTLNAFFGFSGRSLR